MKFLPVFLRFGFVSLAPLWVAASVGAVGCSSGSEADADAVFAAGWSERALHDAILTTCLFNFMNRLLDGHGCPGNAQIFKERGQGLARDGYAPLLRFLE